MAVSYMAVSYKQAATWQSATWLCTPTFSCCATKSCFRLVSFLACLIQMQGPSCTANPLRFFASSARCARSTASSSPGCTLRHTAPTKHPSNLSDKIDGARRQAVESRQPISKSSATAAPYSPKCYTAPHSTIQHQRKWYTWASQRLGAGNRGCEWGEGLSKVLGA